MSSEVTSRRSPGRVPAPIRRILITICWLGFLWSAPAFAHKLTLFAYASDGEVHGQTYFSGGAPARARITISDATGHLLGEIRSGADGQFSYRPEVRGALQLTATTGDGHQAVWRIAAAELAGTAHDPDPPPAAIDTSAPSASAGSSATVDPTLAAALERAVASQVGPLRAELMAERQRVRLHDILGGIGYIFGLTGLVLWLRQRRQHRNV